MKIGRGNRFTWLVATSLALGGVAVGFPQVAESAGPPVKIRQDLTATASDPDARGKLRFALKGAADGRLVISVGRLDRDAAYDLIADGVKVGTLDTTGGGSGRIRLRSEPRSSQDVRLGFDPRGATMVLRDSSGDDVLAGTVSDDSLDPDKIACCVPHGDEGSECEDRTEAECAAEGGTATTSVSCLPDPCEQAPVPGEKIVCCIPDDDEAECEDRSEAECAAEGGTVVDATSCDPNPCAATPPAEDEIACCVPDDDEGPECETLSAEACAAVGGEATEATTCNPDPCGGTPTPSVTPTPDDTPKPSETPESGSHGGDRGHGGGDD